MLTSPNALVAILGLVGTVALARPASAQEVIVTAPIIPAPPSVFVATTAPVYYENHASYWYHDRWVWRDHHGWHAYEHEPVFLHEHRMRPAPRRWHYEHHRR
jgi:hypothetical protein